MSGPDVFASYHPSSAVPDRGSFKSRLIAVGFPAPYMKSPEVDIMVHGANPQLQLPPPARALQNKKLQLNVCHDGGRQVQDPTAESQHRRLFILKG